VAIGSQRQPPAKADVELQKLKDNLYLLVGGGGNSAALVTDLGVVLVDTKLAGWGQPMLDKIKTVTSKPVTTIINTHAHGDSVSGNEFFPTSVEIIAQQGTRLNMDKLDAFKGVKVNFLPKLMFKEKMTIGSGKDRVDLYYFGAGHTGGDAWVVFPAARVMHAGDMLMSKQPPIIDVENGGSGLAYSDTLADAARLKNIDAVIPSHGPMMTMKDVEEYAQFNKEFRDAAVSGFNHGLGVSEVADAWKLPDKYRGYAAPPDRVKANVRAIFSELTR
jgi:glyoxylase-like metal-dependent hydrolase (beta-lactamase superfamily II)